MQGLRRVIGKNIMDLRKALNMTQAELGEKLNYSDKAISKWERGESLPDIVVLKQLTDIFHVSVDYLLHEEHDAKEVERSEIIKSRNENRAIITLLSTAVVWLVATVVFVLFEILPLNVGRFLWMSYVYAIPASLVVVLIFNCIWGKRSVRFVIISALMWSILLAAYLSYPNRGTQMIFLLGIPGQIIIYLWGRIRSVKDNRKSKTLAK